MPEMPHRLQVTLNGRRFEFDSTVARSNCTFFQNWYSNALPNPLPTEINGVKFSFSQTPQELRLPAADQAGAEAAAAAGVAPQPAMLDVFSFSHLPSAMPDYFGLIQVALRKGRVPALNWGELSRAEQEAVAWIINTFGIDKFGQFSNPTATEESWARALEEASKPPSAKKDDEGGCSTDLPSLQQFLVVKIRAEIARREAEGGGAEKQKADASSASAAAASSAAAQPAQNKRPRIVQDDSDDENLALPRHGCFFCGYAGDHDEKDCPHKKAAEQLVQHVQHDIVAVAATEEDVEKKKLQN